MSSDVCKHCTSAACLDVCPTGALFRTEFGTVVVQEDVCNGCGYCVPACPFGVIDKREPDGRVWKCTLCYDRLHGGMEPACAQACPTQSIQFGPLAELRSRAANRVAELHDHGVGEARLYGADPNDGVDGFGAFFLLLDDPEVYGLPPDPVVTTRDLPQMWRRGRSCRGRDGWPRHRGVLRIEATMSPRGGTHQPSDSKPDTSLHRRGAREGLPARERSDRRGKDGSACGSAHVLRPAGVEGAGVEMAHPCLLLHRWPCCRIVDARGRARDCSATTTGAPGPMSWRWLRSPRARDY